jgi:hypothetical protein
MDGIALGGAVLDCFANQSRWGKFVETEVYWEVLPPSVPDQGRTLILNISTVPLSPCFLLQTPSSRGSFTRSLWCTPPPTVLLLHLAPKSPASDRWLATESRHLNIFSKPECHLRRYQ